MVFVRLFRGDKKKQIWEAAAAPAPMATCLAGRKLRTEWLCWAIVGKSDFDKIWHRL